VTFNPSAIPVAVLLLVFAFFVGTRRAMLLDRYDRKRRRTRSPTNRKLQMRYAGFVSAVGVVLAAFVLFYNFDR